MQRPLLKCPLNLLLTRLAQCHSHPHRLPLLGSWEPASSPVSPAPYPTCHQILFHCFKSSRTCSITISTFIPVSSSRSTSLFSHYFNWNIVYIPQYILLKWLIQWFFSIFTMLCNHHSYLIPEHFHQRKREALYPSAVPIPPSPFPLSTTNLLYGSIKSPVMDISQNGNHTICSLLCVCSRIHLRNFSDFFTINGSDFKACFTVNFISKWIKHNVFKFHLCCSMY